MCSTRYPHPKDDKIEYLWYERENTQYAQSDNAWDLHRVGAEIYTLASKTPGETWNKGIEDETYSGCYIKHKQ